MWKRDPKSLAVLAVIFSSGLAHHAAFGYLQKAQSGVVANSPDDAEPVLVELFTSEGCSSCPPADEFIQRLDKLQPVPGAQLIVLSEHVTYWDHEGWKDPFSSAMLTERQEEYERALGASTPYTPQIIIDGKAEVRLSEPKQIETVFRQALSNPKVKVHIGSVTVDPAKPGLLQAHVQVDATPGKQGGEVFVAVALDHADSQILHGENGGRHLSHVAVVLQLDKVGKVTRDGGFDANLAIPLKHSVRLQDLRLVAFVQEAGPGRLVGAALWRAKP